jgi:hypothetical protein
VSVNLIRMPEDHELVSMSVMCWVGGSAKIVRFSKFCSGNARCRESKQCQGLINRGERNGHVRDYKALLDDFEQKVVLLAGWRGSLKENRRLVECSCSISPIVIQQYHNSMSSLKHRS